MEGRIGAIYIGDKQVGGFFDWRVKLNIVDGHDGDVRTHQLQSWKAVAFAHWITRALAPGAELRLRFCASVGLAYWEGVGKITSRPTTSIQMLVHIPIEFIGHGELEAKEMPS